MINEAVIEEIENEIIHLRNKKIKDNLEKIEWTISR
jgi:hypothetical protein